MTAHNSIVGKLFKVALLAESLFRMKFAMQPAGQLMSALAGG